MEILQDIQSARERFQEIRQSGKSIGFVPTMGALHEGHLSLVRKALEENDQVVVSIFVNPTQFNDPEDLQNYPRDYKADEQLLKDAGAHLVFYPGEGEIYPDNYRFKVIETEESLILEGAYREGHFDGVLTVVLKLLNIVGAEKAYFGEKDWQQLSLVRGMCRSFFINTDIVGCGIVREKDGLAMSSRNALLSREEREQAPCFHRILSGEGSPEEKTALLEDCGFTVDYVEELEGRLLGAVRLGKVRLIDNVPI